ncbi:MAG: insulinase family protein, partial [Campylobacterales bacterium]|nr:insulinase family protein [Campylobacterales bacterium]
MQNKTFKTIVKNDKKYNILALPGTNFFKFEIINMYGSNIERAVEKKYNKNLYGISHFIEHLAFKSTQDFTTQELLQLGKKKGVFNASTSYDRINYWFKTTMDKLDTSISFVCNTALNDFAKIAQEEFDIEKQVVFNEAKRAYDNHQQMFYRNALREVLAYHEEDNIIGKPETIETFTLKDAQDLKAIFLNHDKNIYNITYDSSVENIDTIIEKIELELQRFETPKLGEIEISDDEYRELLKLPIDGNYKMANDSKQAMTTILLNSVDNVLVSSATNNYLSSLAEETSLNDLIREKNGLTYGIEFYTRMISYKPYLNFSCDVTKGNESKLLELFKESISLSAKEFTKE